MRGWKMFGIVEMMVLSIHFIATGKFNMLLIYTRVSTAEQADDNKTSLENQERIGQGFAMAKGFNKFDVAVYSDPGVSASIPLRQRPDGKRLLEDVKKGDTVFAAKFDRMFRSARDALNMAEIFKEKGVSLVLFNLGSEPVNGNGVGEFFFTMMAAVAQLERTLINERLAEGKRAKKAAGGHTGGEAQFGYRIIGSGRNARIETVPEEQQVIEKVRELLGENPCYGPAHIKRELTEAGFVSRSGKPFFPMQVSRIMEQVQNAAH